ncbi:MAG: hypothetical protein HYV07_20210 [Deltaproteobacteria bacterium]|nr:hypothetical protein [Deltaproteobacteria bacterium]
MKSTVVVLAIASAAFIGCSETTTPPDAGTPPVDSGGEVQPDAVGPVDTGGIPDLGTPDTGTPDTGEPVPDTGTPDTGAPVPDAGTPDVGPEPDAGVAPTNVAVSGTIYKLGEYLSQNNVAVGQVSVLAVGVNNGSGAAPATLTSADPGTLGQYSLSIPANGQSVFFASKLGYNPTYRAVTTAAADIPNRTLYLAENAWVNAIAAEHGVDLNTPGDCHAPPAGNLDPTYRCIYGLVVGQIRDDGGPNGTPSPVAGIQKAHFRIEGGSPLSTWYVKGPYFLNADGTPNAANTASVIQGNRGGLYVFFAEIPQTQGGYPSVDLSIRIEYPAAAGTRYFGPAETKVFRPYGVTWRIVDESGLAPPVAPNVNVDFDTQVYPLFLPVTQGGFGCQGCHTNQGGAVPAGGMNLYGGPETAFASLNPASYPTRTNVANPSASLVLKKPLYEIDGLQDHPIFAFASPQDPGYQLIYTWIQEGAIRNVVPPVISFATDVRPILYNPTTTGGAGCVSCHGDANNIRGGFFVGGDAAALHAELTGEAPTDNGQTGEPYRINKQGYPERSLVLINPLAGNAEPHPVKLFGNNADPRYATIYSWIQQGYPNN